MNKEQFKKKYAWMEEKVNNPYELWNDLEFMLMNEKAQAIAEHEAKLTEQQLYDIIKKHCQLSSKNVIRDAAKEIFKTLKP